MAEEGRDPIIRPREPRGTMKSATARPSRGSGCRVGPPRQRSEGARRGAKVRTAAAGNGADAVPAAWPGTAAPPADYTKRTTPKVGGRDASDFAAELVVDLLSLTTTSASFRAFFLPLSRVRSHLPTTAHLHSWVHGLDRNSDAGHLSGAPGELRGQGPERGEQRRAPDGPDQGIQARACFHKGDQGL